MATQTRGNIEQITEDMRTRASSMADDVGGRMKDYYNQSTDWLEQNYGKTLAVVGVLAAIGLAGYLFAQRERKSEKEQERRAA